MEKTEEKPAAPARQSQQEAKITAGTEACGAGKSPKDNYQSIKKHKTQQGAGLHHRGEKGRGNEGFAANVG